MFNIYLASKYGSEQKRLRITYGLALGLAAALNTTVLADTPLGWINSANPTAYTTTKGDLEIAAAGLAVNSTLDVFGYRDDLIAASGRLEGDSGDLSGSKLELHYGITEDLSVFFSRQLHSLTLDLGEISSVDLVDIDESLETLAQSAGIKWTFYRSNLLNQDNRHSAASIEITAFQSESQNFDVVLEEIRLDNLTVIFGIPQTFSIANMEDEGWKSRLLYSWPLQRSSTATVWTGYGESTATSGTTSDLKSATIKRFFEQSFDIEEEYFYLGAGLNAYLTPRLSLNLSYEYISLMNADFSRFPADPLPQLPSFLSGSSQAEVDNNHTFKARLAYWLTPEINLSLTGNLYSNQFVGVLPHYSNPLSGSFSSTPYGFAGVELLYKFSGLP